MEQVNENNLEPTKLYYVELDNDSLRQYGAYSLKHYARFIKYIQNESTLKTMYKFSIDIKSLGIPYGPLRVNYPSVSMQYS